MQKMTALSEDGESTKLGYNQENYLKKKIFKLASNLDEQVKAIHPALSIGFKVHPTPMTFEMDLSLSTPALPRQHLAVINGQMDLKWAHLNGHGKELNINAGIATGTGRGQRELFEMMPLNHRREIRDVTLKITGILTDLNAIPDISNHNAHKAWLIVKQLDFQPWKAKKNLSEIFDAHSEHPNTPNGDMTSAIERATQRLASNFRRRYSKRNNIFDNVDFHYNFMRQTLECNFTLNADRAVNDRHVKISMPVTVGYKSGINLFYATTQHGDRIEISDTASSAEVMQLMLETNTIVDSDDLFQKGEKNDKTQRIQKRVRSYVPKKAGKKFQEIANDNTDSKDDDKFLGKRDRNRHARRVSRHQLRARIS